ncbi:YARHG domain-containing protein [Bacillus sp. DX1.1]|uniref:TcaA 3rd/4th domain-containing protein n=1 Tax=unclassified Bacillus (in: firmicutes) TaxID=185979 RepID=UPI00257043CC|nr:MULTISPECIES: YARHG domain-containing protein [unclassified Bacillus (in: firmicutes)]MDM5153888.1 YARHG domain-containing protein [Bacillus sp. DX1.1]WJE82822.1 YARHG domain-containing protein [Bacillus sp. DX3.1]
MNICTKCGLQLDDGQQFCQQCGHDISNEPEPPVPKSRRMSKGKKIWFAILAICIICIGGAYLYGAKYYSAEAQIDRIVTILQERNTEKLIDVVKTDDPQFLVDEETVKPLFNYIKEYPSYITELKASIQQQKKKQNEVGKVDFALTKDGKYFFLFDRYKLKAKTYYVSLLADEKDAVLKMNGKELDKTNDKMFEKQYGPFFPGLQIFQSEYKNEYVKLQREEKVLLMKQSQNNVTVDLALKGHYITIQTNVTGATLYANQKPITTLMGEEIKWGPVATDGSVSIYLEKDGPSGKERTKVENVTTGQSYTLSFQKEPEKQPAPSESTPPQYSYNDFYFRDSHLRKLTSANLRNLTKGQLQIARNEIYARHGHIFESKEMRAYFLKQSWYRENSYYTGELNEVETYNAELIKSME